MILSFLTQIYIYFIYYIFFILLLKTLGGCLLPTPAIYMNLWLSYRWPKRVCCNSVPLPTLQPTMTASWSKSSSVVSCRCENLMSLILFNVWYVCPSQPRLQCGILQELHACHECFGQSRYSNIYFPLITPSFPTPSLSVEYVWYLFPVVVLVLPPAESFHPCSGS